jgi:hypothetical protein
VNEFETQCWICPKCFDDHAQDGPCTPSDFERELLAEAIRIGWKDVGAKGEVLGQKLAFASGARWALRSRAVRDMADALQILKDDAEFFTGDVRKLTAWGRIEPALKAYDAEIKER